MQCCDIAAVVRLRQMLKLVSFLENFSRDFSAIANVKCGWCDLAQSERITTRSLQRIALLARAIVSRCVTAACRRAFALIQQGVHANERLKLCTGHLHTQRVLLACGLICLMFSEVSEAGAGFQHRGRLKVRHHRVAKTPFNLIPN